MILIWVCPCSLCLNFNKADYVIYRKGFVVCCRVLFTQLIIDSSGLKSWVVYIHHLAFRRGPVRGNLVHRYSLQVWKRTKMWFALSILLRKTWLRLFFGKMMLFLSVCNVIFIFKVLNTFMTGIVIWFYLHLTYIKIQVCCYSVWKCS